MIWNIEKYNPNDYKVKWNETKPEYTKIIYELNQKEVSKMCCTACASLVACANNINYKPTIEDLKTIWDECKKKWSSDITWGFTHIAVDETRRFFKKKDYNIETSYTEVWTANFWHLLDLWYNLVLWINTWSNLSKDVYDDWDVDIYPTDNEYRHLVCLSLDNWVYTITDSYKWLKKYNRYTLSKEFIKAPFTQKYAYVFINKWNLKIDSSWQVSLDNLIKTKWLPWTREHLKDLLAKNTIDKKQYSILENYLWKKLK